jgi:ribosomal protein S18 acetylase RimI-like enzyme
VAEIGCVTVDEANRGQGLGRAVVKSLRALAAAHGAHSTFLQVDLTNASAIRLYQRLGFVTASAYKTMALVIHT